MVLVKGEIRAKVKANNYAILAYTAVIQGAVPLGNSLEYFWHNITTGRGGGYVTLVGHSLSSSFLMLTRQRYLSESELKQTWVQR